MSSPVRILGIDPGLNRTGWGAIESAGGRLRCVASGVIRVLWHQWQPRLIPFLQPGGASIPGAGRSSDGGRRRGPPCACGQR